MHSGSKSTGSEHVEPVVDISQLINQPGSSNSTAGRKVSLMAQLPSGTEMDNIEKTGSFENIKVSFNSKGGRWSKR